MASYWLLPLGKLLSMLYRGLKNLTPVYLFDRLISVSHSNYSHSRNALICKAFHVVMQFGLSRK